MKSRNSMQLGGWILQLGLLLCFSSMLCAAQSTDETTAAATAAPAPGPAPDAPTPEATTPEPTTEAPKKLDGNDNALFFAIDKGKHEYCAFPKTSDGTTDGKCTRLNHCMLESKDKKNNVSAIYCNHITYTSPLGATYRKNGSDDFKFQDGRKIEEGQCCYMSLGSEGDLVDTTMKDREVDYYMKKDAVHSEANTKPTCDLYEDTECQKHVDVERLPHVNATAAEGKGKKFGSCMLVDSQGTAKCAMNPMAVTAFPVLELSNSSAGSSEEDIKPYFYVDKNFFEKVTIPGNKDKISYCDFPRTKYGVRYHCTRAVDCFHKVNADNQYWFKESFGGIFCNHITQKESSLVAGQCCMYNMQSFTAMRRKLEGIDAANTEYGCSAVPDAVGCRTLSNSAGETMRKRLQCITLLVAKDAPKEVDRTACVYNPVFEYVPKYFSEMHIMVMYVGFGMFGGCCCLAMGSFILYRSPNLGKSRFKKKEEK